MLNTSWIGRLVWAVYPIWGVSWSNKNGIVIYIYKDCFVSTLVAFANDLELNELLNIALVALIYR
jgi:hypothetical protein